MVLSHWRLIATFWTLLFEWTVPTKLGPKTFQGRVTVSKCAELIHNMWTVGSTVRIMFASLARWMFETNWLMFSEERWPEGELFHHCWGVEHGIEWHMPSSCEMFFAIYNPGVRISFKPSRVARYKRWQYWVALVCPFHFVVLINICNSVWKGSRITQQERRFFANCASSLNLQRLTLQDLFHHAFWSGAFLSSTCLFGGDLTLLSVLYSWL